MKEDIFSRLRKKNTTLSIIFWRRFRYFFIGKDNFSEDFLRIEYDDTFSNSLVIINFHFKNLIYLAISGLDHKLYNGKVVLNSNRVQFPISLKAVTGNGIFQYTIESRNVQNVLNTEGFSVEFANVRNVNYKNLGTFDHKVVQKRIKNIITDGLFQTNNIKIKHNKPNCKKEKVSINPTTFNKNENL